MHTNYLAQKNRPGQRTRRKLILQKYGKDAKIFREARARKVARVVYTQSGWVHLRMECASFACDAVGMRNSRRLGALGASRQAARTGSPLRMAGGIRCLIGGMRCLTPSFCLQPCIKASQHHPPCVPALGHNLADRAEPHPSHIPHTSLTHPSHIPGSLPLTTHAPPRVTTVYVACACAHASGSNKGQPGGGQAPRRQWWKRGQGLGGRTWRG